MFGYSRHFSKQSRNLDQVAGSAGPVSGRDDGVAGDSAAGDGGWPRLDMASTGDVRD